MVLEGVEGVGVFTPLNSELMEKIENQRGLQLALYWKNWVQQDYTWGQNELPTPFSPKLGLRADYGPSRCIGSAMGTLNSSLRGQLVWRDTRERRRSSWAAPLNSLTSTLWETGTNGCQAPTFYIHPLTLLGKELRSNGEMAASSVPTHPRGWRCWWKLLFYGLAGWWGEGSSLL